MRFRNRVILAIASAAFSVGVALTPVAFAEDSGKTGAMFQGTKSKDTMAKDAMSKDAMGKDSMKKDEMTR
jgi:pentapeptide MXKDX repeat protein